ncbi:PTS glucose transporter subunit IIA [Allobacillus sp. GCM10007490]|uniref:PTS glucose transporter subunit IIA n=1 Tax=Allobacillus salarius TaxID=1955272 RepID=A0A556P6S2_9BACI|nr:PTS glucose transporter subunit IIA [Allobacillus salarius]
MAEINQPLNFAMPVTGRIIPITDVDDEVFSQKMMGDGFAIEPNDGKIVSPVDGTIVTVFPTKHAIGIESKEGYEVLIHVGLDTVNLNGEGFEQLVTEGDQVTQGDALLTADLQVIKEKAPSTVTPIVFTNLKDDQYVKILKDGKQDSGAEGIIEIASVEDK